ncbi:MAG: hypothetical protein ACRCS6_02100 [Turicibacter sp.]
MLVKIRYVKTVVMDTETNEIVSFTESVESESGSTVELGATTAPKKKASTPKKVVEDSGKLSLTDNKLVLTPSIAEKIGAVAGDRVAINYVSKGDDYIPVISKSVIFGDPEAGNKLTKSLTVSFKGKQAKSLEQYGKEFELRTDESLSEGVYMLVDPNFVGLETITEDKLIKVEAKSIETSPEDLIDKYEDESLSVSENNINFDFDFDNI